MPSAFSKTNITLSLVRRLVDAQFPGWAHLPLRPVELDGWDNTSFRLGDELSVRLPSAERYVQQVQKEHTWLPRLAPCLPLPIPVPLAIGQPGEGYPWQWSVYRWIQGRPAARETVADLPEFAASLGQFLRALMRIDAAGGPPPGDHNFMRGAHPSFYDAETRRALVTLQGQVDVRAAAAVWEAALQSSWQSPPVWFHGDVALGNLLVQDGRLSAVIDFGSSAVGDPACDLVIAWTFLHGQSRSVFRQAIGLDPDTWARGRGWALWKALITLAGHAVTNAPEAVWARQVIDQVILDQFPAE